MQNLLAVADFQHLLFPGLLLVYYVIAWLVAGRDPKIVNVVPQYEPPPGISPGVARYVLTGGSDGTTLAAVLAGLAAKGVISIQPQDGKYTAAMMNSRTAVLPDEASLIKSMFGVTQPVQSYPDTGGAIVGAASSEVSDTSNANLKFGALGQQLHDDAIFPDDAVATAVGLAAASKAETSSQIILDPRERQTIANHLSALQATFRENLQGVYFRQNFRFAGLGMLATFAWGLFVAFTLNASSSVFITFWLLLFTSLSGLVIGGVWTSKPTQPSAQQRVWRVLLPVLFFALPGAAIYFAALPQAHGFVLALLLAVLLNNIFFVINRAPTQRGLEVLQQLAGFREFLMRAEQDPLDRINTPEQRAEIMNRFLPYAIALNVREGWGDKMASAFSDAVVER
jgi:hypothetical protein